MFGLGTSEDKLREIIQNDELGRVIYMSATRTNLGPYRQDANALWDLSSHDLSIFEHWLHMRPSSVNAHGGHFLSPDIADVVMGSFQYDNGVMASVQASWLNPRKVREIYKRVNSAYEQSGSDGQSAELLGLDYIAETDPERALVHARRAAELAEAAFAFGRAARLYKLALAIEPDSERKQLLERYAQVFLRRVGG